MRQSVQALAQSRCSVNGNAPPLQKPVEPQEPGSSGHMLGVTGHALIRLLWVYAAPKPDARADGAELSQDDRAPPCSMCVQNCC